MPISNCHLRHIDPEMTYAHIRLARRKVPNPDIEWVWTGERHRKRTWAEKRAMVASLVGSSREWLAGLSEHKKLRALNEERHFAQLARLRKEQDELNNVPFGMRIADDQLRIDRQIRTLLEDKT